MQNINDDYLRYMTSPQKAKDEQNGLQPPFSFNPGFTIRSKENQADIFQESILIPNVNYDPASDPEKSSVRDVSSIALKSMSFLTMIISLGASIALIKIFQMMDFMLYFEVKHPSNFIRFLELMSSNFLGDFPNIFRFLVDDDCPLIRTKFAENELSCQFISNCGQLVFITLILMLIKVIFWILNKAVQDPHKLPSNFARRIMKINNEILNIEFFISVMDMFQLDFYVAIFLQMDALEIRSGKSMINIGVAIVFLVGLMFTKLYLFFVSTRVAKVRTETSIKEKGYRKHYLDYMFLSNETHANSWYSLHHMAVNLLKDPVISVFLVFASKVSLVQTGSVLVIMSLYFFLEMKDRPRLQVKENIRNMISLGVYTLAITFFLVLAFRKDDISEFTREKVIGIPLIILFSILILSNYVISTYETIMRCRQRCKKKPEDEAKAGEAAADPESKAVAAGANLAGLSGIKLKRRPRADLDAEKNGGKRPE